MRVGHVAAHAPGRLYQRRALRTSAPKEVGPLIAGIGIAAVAYGTKLLVEAAQSGRAQQVVSQAAEAVRDAASAAQQRSASAAASGRKPDAAEPDEAQRRSSVNAYFTTDVMGVDLGEGAKAWSGASAAIVDSRSARVVENEQGMRATPSLVAFTESGDILVGQPAKKLLFARGATPVTGFSQMLGLRFDSQEFVELRDAGAFGKLEVIADTRERDISDDVDANSRAAAIRVHGLMHRPEELSSRVLGSLKGSAEAALGNRVVLSAVIAAPVCASVSTRNAIIAAGKRAGLRRVELIDAPVAGACAASLELPTMTDVANLGVYELGGRGFSFSVLERSSASSPGWSVRAARRHTLLGSESFDLAIVDWLAASFQAEHGIDLSKDHLALQRLHEAAESAKLELCSAPQASVSLPFITADAEGPKHLDTSLTRAKLDELIEPVLQHSLTEVDKTLGDAGMHMTGLDGVLLVGGAARLASVADLVTRHANGVPVHRTDRPEEVIALGAAVYAQELQELEFAAQ